MKVISTHRITIPDNIDEEPTPKGTTKLRPRLFDGEISEEGHEDFLRMMKEANEESNQGG